MVRRPRAHRLAPSRAARARDRHRAPPALRILLIALGLLIGQASTLLHLLVVPHTTCEHGELLELHAAPIATAPSAAPETPDPSVKAASPADGEHQHCAVNAQIHRLPDLPPRIGEASLLCIEPPVTIGERGETRPVALLALAPKSSPPLA